MIKAIDTIYNGYKFRSRLEARWAVFFDYLKIKYEYEKQGFNLDGDLYLPDFWLPVPEWFDWLPKGSGYWVEIKPQELNQTEESKLEKLVLAAGHNAYAFAGNIGFGEFTMHKWALDRKNNRINRFQFKEIEFPSDNLWGFYGLFGYNERIVEDAIFAARSARFEFNQTGI